MEVKKNVIWVYMRVMGIDMDRLGGLPGLIDTETLLSMNVCT